MSWRCLVLEQWAERSDDSSWRLDGIQEVVALNIAFPVAQTVKRLSAMLKTRVWSLGQEDPWRRKWQPTPVLLPGESHGQRSLVGYNHWHGVAKSQTQLSDLTYFYVIQDTTDFPSAVFPIERIYFILPKYIEGF